MSAIVTILRSKTEESIQMYVEPEEKVEDIKDRCMGYWQIDDDTDKFTLSKNNTGLISSKTVISSDIQEGDVLRFGRSSKVEKSGKKENVSETVEDDDAVGLAEEWLQQNIGLDLENLELLDRAKDDEDGFKLLFKNNDIDEHYTILVGSDGVKNYIPAIVDDMRDT